jgi:Protein of unknown function (DUF2490)
MTREAPSAKPPVPRRLGVAALPGHAVTPRLATTLWTPIAASGLLIASPAAAGDSQGWASASATIRLSDRWSLSQDVTARFSDRRDGLYDLEANTLIGLRVTDSVTVWAGYDHDPQYAAGRFTIMEHRLPQILAIDRIAAIGSGKLSGRIRLEERWRDGLPGTGWRVRPYLRYALPIERSHKLSLVWSEEPFFNMNRTGFQTVRGLDRLRSYAGVNAPLTKRLSVDVGYLNQRGFVRHGRDTVDNVALVSLGLKL